VGTCTSISKARCVLLPLLRGKERAPGGAPKRHPGGGADLVMSRAASLAPAPFAPSLLPPDFSGAVRFRRLLSTRPMLQLLLLPNYMRPRLLLLLLQPGLPRPEPITTGGRRGTVRPRRTCPSKRQVPWGTAQAGAVPIFGTNVTSSSPVIQTNNLRRRERAQHTQRPSARSL
jgi:hypothetical protein